MKHKKIILSLMVVMLLVTITTAQEKFPSRDSKEWNSLTVAQRWQAVNIHEEQLNKMSTNDLIEHCINFSFMWDIFNHPTYGIGLNIVIEQHNGLYELLNRKDAGQLIFDFYNKIDLNKITELSEPTDRGKFVAQIFFLELFLSHSNILNQFQGTEKELIKGILRTHDICLDINSKIGKDLYSGYSIGTKVLAIGKVLEHLKGIDTNDPALKQMDLSQLSKENYKKIIEDARGL